MTPLVNYSMSDNDASAGRLPDADTTVEDEELDAQVEDASNGRGKAREYVDLQTFDSEETFKIWVKEQKMWH